jgi:hypothetical protein
MISILSLVTSVKDYVEIIHKLIETDSNFKISNYSDLGPVITFILITLKQFFIDVLSLNWLKTIWDLPIIIPDISSAMISEISVLDGYFHNAFNFLDKPISYGETNIAIYSLEKFSVGLINSLFLCIPTGTTHLITLRRFIMQGLEAGYLAGLGSICGNILWISSIIFGWRFFVIPWLSLDIFRYLLGFVLLVKYMWDSYGDSQKKIDVTTTSAKQKIFLLNFLLALTEQTSLYPFISNISIGSESSLLESFPAQNYIEFLSIHGSYILGLVIGCFSLLHLTCWFWENPAFKIYMWVISSFKISTTVYYKVLNFTFLYLTMICAISSIPYYGLDYTLTNPLGFVQDDRILDQKLILETSFINAKASDRNTRRNRGRHGRRERWKRRIRKYRTFDASLYDQGIYDLFTIEDLNYGFDRFWLRRKMRNHRVRFRFFPGPWMRSFKKQLAKPRLESYAGPRQEFFRILFEQVYHPSFHEYAVQKTKNVSGGTFGNKLTTAVSGGNIALAKKNQLEFGQSYQQQEKVNNNTSISKSAILTSGSGKLGTLTSEQQSNASIFSFLPKKEFSIYSTNFNNTGFKIDTALKNTSSKPSTSKDLGSTDYQSASQQFGSDQELNQQKTKFNIQDNLKIENSTLRKFVRKINNRLKNSEITSNLTINSNKFKVENGFIPNKEIFMINEMSLKNNSLYSKRWKEIFSKISHNKEQLAGNSSNGQLKGLFKNFYQSSLTQNKKIIFEQENDSIISKNKEFNIGNLASGLFPNKILDQGKIKKENSKINLSKQDKQTLKYRSILNSSLKGKSATARKEMALLHPLKFYLKKQEAFERKLRYYTPTIFRKFSIENNAPYFRVMMKRYFYYFKPTLRWERTMKVASLRKARRKTAVSARKIQLGQTTLREINSSKENKDSIISNFPEGNNLSLDIKTTQNPLLSLDKNQVSFNKLSQIDTTLSSSPTGKFAKEIFPGQDRKIKATHNYTIVGKRASRFRYEIYKDVLQHWYYSPFNRLLLKFDIDLFIKRQPNSHFLTKNEEKLLHLRRFLLSEHYNTLRWYSYMQHYRSMKTKIGGTKSFASKVYNQQFSGTFKKIRHLFAITPSQSNQSVLKFDQPLYNESFNNSKNSLQKNLIIHEELLNNNPKFQTENFDFSSLKNPDDLSIFQREVFRFSENSPKEGEAFPLLGTDLLNQSTGIIGTYLKNSDPIKQEYIKNLIEDKNYLKLTEFLYKGQKTRGSKPITNESSLINQEKEYLLTDVEKQEFNNLEKIKLNKMLRPLQQDLWVSLLKRWKQKINDQEFLKNYLQRRIEKREKRKQKKEKNLKTKLERLETWSGTKNNIDTPKISSSFSSDSKENSGRLPLRGNLGPSKNAATILSSGDNSSLEITTGVNKALTEGISTLQKTGTSNINFSVKNSKEPYNTTYSKENQHLHIGRDILKNASFLKKEKDVTNSLNNFTKIIKELNQSKSNDGLSNHLKRNSFKIQILNISMKIKNILKTYKFKSSKLILSSTNKLVNIFKPITRRNINLKIWQQRERSLNKQKRSRKEFKLFSKKPFQNNTIAATSSTERFRVPKNYFPQGRESFPLGKYLNDLESKTENQIENKNSFFRKKRDFSNNNVVSETKSLQNNVPINDNLITNINNDGKWNISNKIKATYIKYFWRPSKFKRKKSPQRRARVRRNRGVTKKRTLSDSLKREFKNLRKYAADSSIENQPKDLSQRELLGEKMDSLSPKELTKIDSKKQKIYLSFRNAASINDATLSNQTTLQSEKANAVAYDGIFKQSPLQRRSKQKKQRFWKQKRSKYSQKLRKYKKRRRSVLSKVRILNKQLKRIQSTTELKNWWWKNFLPNLRATTDSLLQFEKDRQIQQKLLELSIPEILERDKLAPESSVFSRLNQNLAKDLKGLLNEGIFSVQKLPSDTLQIGDYDFKPLSMPEAIRLREKNINLNNQLMSNNQQLNNNYNKIITPQNDSILTNLDSKGYVVPTGQNTQSLSKETKSNEIKSDIISKISQASLSSVPTSSVPLEKLPLKQIFSTNIVPFYAGWDESLRKFVVTNRLLSRRSSGFEQSSQRLSMNSRDLENPGILSESLTSNNKNSEELLTDNFKLFSEAPLKGMNAATTLYWQIPFTTYDPDQFFALGMDGFAPLGWRRFQFRHSILKSWIMNRGKSVQNSTLFKKQEKSPSTIANSKNSFATIFSSDNSLERENKNKVMTISKTKTNILNRIYNQTLKSEILFQNNILNVTDSSFKNIPMNSEAHGLSSRGIKLSKPFEQSIEKNKNIKNIYRRLKKRYKRVKKHPRSPVWFPSGPLLNQVLPVHYIYIFYKRSRLPRDRYIKRRLRKSKTIALAQEGNNPIGNTSNIIAMKDFTLRKRIKTKRKYHIKQDLNKNTTLIPRRMKFIGLSSNTEGSSDLTMRWRPLSRQKINKPISELIKEQRALKYKQRKKDEASVSGNKQTPNLRVKQLRRRVQRQIIRSVWRYKPRAGGFVWPGDYLKLEQVKAPKLNSSLLNLNKQQDISNIDVKTASIKVKRKKKRNIQEWQIQPKKYLLEKHNLNAIKKKLEKANRSNKIRERVKELNLTL